MNSELKEYYELLIMNYELIDSYPFYVEPFHVDFTGRIFLGVLGNHMLNAAGNHSHKRGWGISEQAHMGNLTPLHRDDGNAATVRALRGKDVGEERYEVLHKP